ncbi:MAG: c-type cytochrome domain-containing protein [Pirellulales bacterium]
MTSDESVALNRHISSLCLSAVLLSLGIAPSAIGQPTSSQVEFFEQRIRPFLASECYECQGAKKQEGGRRVDSRDGLLKGGDSGPALVAGDSGKSLLIELITNKDSDSFWPVSNCTDCNRRLRPVRAPGYAA